MLTLLILLTLVTTAVSAETSSFVILDESLLSASCVGCFNSVFFFSLQVDRQVDRQVDLF